MQTQPNQSLPKKPLPNINFDGAVVSPNNGKYKCPFNCHSSGFPAPSWKTENGFRRHMGTCVRAPSALQRKAGTHAQIAVDNKARMESAIAVLGLAVGDKIFYSGYTVTAPTHVMKGGRRVRVRYEEKRHYAGEAVRIESFAWIGALVINGRITERDLCSTLAEAQAKAAADQRSYDEHVDFAAAVR